MPSSWSPRLLNWFARHGRHDLPWQAPRGPYQVWVSEIMLQQTGVATVIPYYQRFMAALPTLESLARVEPDRLMALWSGLGYYARARNLHRAAQIIVEQYAGQFPDDSQTLQSLPGIGRSTAGAILAQAFEQPAAILDGNVKRVLARHAGIEGWPGKAAVLQRLWQEAEHRLPAQDPADYAQAMMDLGATVCTRRAPSCEQCPVASDCVARASGRAEQIPAAKPRKQRPVRQQWYLILRNEQQQILLARRPPAGIWGGLWSLPEAALGMEEFSPLAARLTPLGQTLRHEFSHFSLLMEPVSGQPRSDLIKDDDSLCWHTVTDAVNLGLPQPIRRLIETYCA